MAIDGFFYDKQLKRYALQFNAIFSEMQVQVGVRDNNEPYLISVPIINGSMDRVAAAAATGHTQNRHLRLPMISSNLVNFDIATDRMKGTGFTSRHVYVPSGGMLPDDAQVVRTRMAIPYDLTFDLHVYASNKDQQFQILEQIMTLFDPTLQIQTSDAPFDASKIVTVQLIHINPEENFPPGTESRSLVTTLQFKVDAYITTPASIRQDIVQRVIARVSSVSGGDIGTIYSDGSGNGGIGDIFDEHEVVPQLLADADIEGE